MDREAIARNQRRRLIGEAVELEQERETALLEQLEETVAELEGPRIDEEAFARMTPGDADIVRSVLGSQNPGEEIPEEQDEDWLAPAVDPEAESQELLVEITRLEEEIARSRRRRDAFERYVEFSMVEVALRALQERRPLNVLRGMPPRDPRRQTPLRRHSRARRCLVHDRGADRSRSRSGRTGLRGDRINASMWDSSSSAPLSGRSSCPPQPARRQARGGAGHLPPCPAPLRSVRISRTAGPRRCRSSTLLRRA